MRPPPRLPVSVLEGSFEAVTVSLRSMCDSPCAARVRAGRLAAVAADPGRQVDVDAGRAEA